MRRTQAGRTDAMTASADGEQGFWPSYADMMSAVALILFFLMLLSYIQNLITGNDLQSTQDALAETRDELALTSAQVKEAEDQLASITLDLGQAELALAQQEEKLAGQKELLAQQEQLISDQAAYVEAANEELVEMRGQMQSIAVLRLSILEQIRSSIASVMGSSAKVSIGDNGSIILDEGIFFDTGSADIKEGSIPVLNQLSRVFTQFLSDSENAKYVDSIVISGHTDDVGDDVYNRELSTDRANSVMSYLLEGSLSAYADYFCSAGYGESRPIADNTTEAGRAQNRRIEISIILKDDSILDIVNDYLALSLPDTANVSASASGTQSSSGSAVSSKLIG